MPDGPLGRARAALLDARARAAHSPSGANNKALEEAQAHMDYLLDTLPLVSSPSPPPTPTGPVAHRPGPVVSLEDELLGEVYTPDEVREWECTTTQQDTDSEDD